MQTVAETQFLQGIPCSPGIAIARALVITAEEANICQCLINESDVAAELARFAHAREQSMAQIQALIDRMSDGEHESQRTVFEGHLMLLDDEEFESDVVALVSKSYYSADHAINEATEHYARLVAELDDPYLRERAMDCRDVGARLIRNVLGVQSVNLASIAEEVLIVARDLAPSQTAQMNPAWVKGFVTDLGGRTSHSAIMARSLELPAIVGVVVATQNIATGDLVAIDATRNEIWVRPNSETLNELRRRQSEHVALRQQLLAQRDLPAQTLDGHRVELCANIGMLRDTEGALRNGAEGIGLYRTEFLFMDRESLPNEDEQFKAYRDVALAMAGKAVIVRTMDIGGDKGLPYLSFPKELNPFLGWRAIRIFFDRHDIMRPQLRAILRASAFGKLRIMFPMIASVEEFRTLKAEIEKYKAELRIEGTAFDESIMLGVMIETPAAAVMARHLAREADFFSIGTNDLTQYTLAVDRGNEAIAHLYRPLSPAVLSLIKQVIDATHAEGKWTGMCGELAGDESALALLVGMGLDEFSMSAIALPIIKSLVRSIRYDEAKALASRVLACATADEVLAEMAQFNRSIRATDSLSQVK